MRLALHHQQFSTRRLTRLYIGALSIVALLSICGQLLIQFSLLQQSGDANVINIAGRQRMLSQKLSKAALALLINTKLADQQARMTELNDTLTLWEQSHAGLQHGDVHLGLPGNNSSAVIHLFGVIEPYFQAMSAATEQLLVVVGQEQAKSALATRGELLPDIQIILAQEPKFLTGMNGIVSQYQIEAEGRVTQLKLIELALLGLTLLVLLLEGLMIFRPAIRRLKGAVEALMKAEKQISAHVAELEKKNADLELAFSEAMSAHRKVMPHARVVSFGYYQVQGSQGNYYSVVSSEENGALQLQCECPMYQRNLICSHSLAAATLHSALIRQNPSVVARRYRTMPISGEHSTG